VIPTVGAAVSERTATVIWSVLDGVEEGVFLWNVFPLHPHEADTPFSNRQHNSEERRAGEEILVDLVRRLRPRRSPLRELLGRYGVLEDRLATSDTDAAERYGRIAASGGCRCGAPVDV
jgi:hypothetical protein